LQGQCQHLLSSLKQVQQRLHQQQQLQQSKQQQLGQHPEQQQQQQRPIDPAMPITPSLAQAQAELQLVDCKRQLAEAKAALQDVTAALQSEKAARLAAQDAEAGRQQLLQRIAGLQADSVELHGQLLAERKAAAALREELSLTSTSRDTWRVRMSDACLVWVVCSCWVVEGCEGNRCACMLAVALTWHSKLQQLRCLPMAAIA
jgi:hypothetical protein